MKMICKNDYRLVAFLSYNIYVKYNLKILTLILKIFYLANLFMGLITQKHMKKKKITVRKIHLKDFQCSQGTVGCDLGNQGYHGDGLHHREQAHQTTVSRLCYVWCV